MSFLAVVVERERAMPASTTTMLGPTPISYPELQILSPPAVKSRVCRDANLFLFMESHYA